MMAACSCIPSIHLLLQGLKLLLYPLISQLCLNDSWNYYYFFFLLGFKNAWPTQSIFLKERKGEQTVGSRVLPVSRDEMQQPLNGVLNIALWHPSWTPALSVTVTSSCCLPEASWAWWCCGTSNSSACLECGGCSEHQPSAAWWSVQWGSGPQCFGMRRRLW